MIIHIPGLQNASTKPAYSKFVDFTKIGKIIFTDNSKTGNIKALIGHDDEIVFCSGNNVHINYRLSIENCDLVFCWLQNNLLNTTIDNLIFELNYAKTLNKPIVLATNELTIHLINLVQGLDLLGKPNSFIVGVNSPEKAFAVYKESLAGRKLQSVEAAKLPVVASSNQVTKDMQITGAQVDSKIIHQNYQKTTNTKMQDKVEESGGFITNMTREPVDTRNTQKQLVIDDMLKNSKIRSLEVFPQIGQGVLYAIKEKKWKNASDIARKAAFAFEAELKNNSMTLEQELGFYYDTANATNIKDYLTSLEAKETWWGKYNACKYSMSATKWNIVSIFFQNTLIYKTHLLNKEKLAKLITLINPQQGQTEVENFVYHYIHRGSNHNAALSFAEQLLG